MSTNTEFEVVIGLEVHTQMKTKTKIFCDCLTLFGQAPNSQVCPVCLGYPGVLPVMNEKVIELAVKTCLMMGFEINRQNKMDRKNYFYPDLPKGYQISQFDKPIGVRGAVKIVSEEGVRDIRVNRVHIEEDAGKSLHMDTSTWVDFNRTGVPLLEIVSEPDIRSSKEAVFYLKKIKQILEYGGVSDCNMEEGSLRCDANVSVRLKGETKLGTKAEIKNINSFRYVQKAIDFEVERQIAILKEGGRVIQETRQYNSTTGVTKPMRSKEEAHDYRYFSEPDLVFNVITEEWIEKLKKTLPETPDQKCERFEKQYALPLYDSSVLTADQSAAHFFEEGAKICKNPKMLSNWIMAELMREWNELKVTPEKSPVSPANLAELVNCIEEGKISGRIAKDVFSEMIKTRKNPSQIVQEKGLSLISNISEIESLIANVLKTNDKSVQDFKSGKKNAFGFLVGQIMKSSQGKADPKTVNELLQKTLNC